MNFSLTGTIAILERTPQQLNALLEDLAADWTTCNEGGESWSAYDILGHLIEGEKTDWIPRMEIILSDREDKTFEPFDRFAQQQNSQGKSLNDLLQEFAQMRNENLAQLKARQLTEADLQKKGKHPALGEVSLEQLLATWAVHDLNHTAQIARVMASQYKNEVGPWKAFLKILKS